MERQRLAESGLGEEVVPTLPRGTDDTNSRGCGRFRGRRELPRTDANTGAGRAIWRSLRPEHSAPQLGIEGQETLEAAALVGDLQSVEDREVRNAQQLGERRGRQRQQGGIV